MFDRVIVGVDGGEGGRDAIALGARLLAKDGELTLAYVYHDGPHASRGSSPAATRDYRLLTVEALGLCESRDDGHRDLSNELGRQDALPPSYEAAESERSRQLLERAREEAGVRARLRWEGSSSVGRGLHELAEQDAADLLVLGSCRWGLLGRVLIGDETRAALNGAPCAVAVAPLGYRRERALMREIGVGYNGSPESQHALELARKLADELDAKLSAFEAVALPANAYGFAGVAPGDEAYEQLVGAARQRVAALEGVEAHAAYGQAAEELALYSASLDLLIVGSRGYGPVGRLVHGSTSQQLARTARCPLLVLTRAARKVELQGDRSDGHEATAVGTKS